MATATKKVAATATKKVAATATKKVATTATKKIATQANVATTTDKREELALSIASVYIEMLESRKRGEWVKGWSDGNPLPINGATGEVYKGINVALLWYSKRLGNQFYPQGFSCNIWVTYNQAQELGGQVLSKEVVGSGTKIMFYTWRDRKESDEEDSEEKNGVKGGYPIRRQWTVFNLDQTTGLEHLKEKFAQTKKIVNDSECFDPFKEIPVKVVHNDLNRCYYNPYQDFINMVPLNQFDKFEFYISTKAHELSHWTGHNSRLDRDLKNSFGTPKYAREELVAELSASFICAEMGIFEKIKENNAAYLDSWIHSLKTDPKIIYKVLSDATKAYKLIMSYVREDEIKIAA